MNTKGAVLYALFEWIAPFGATALLLGLVHAGLRERITTLVWDRGRWIVYALSRIAYALGLYLVLDFGGSYDLGVYVDYVERMGEGAVPGRDFSNGYGPLFYYARQVIAGALGGPAPLTVLVPTLLADLVCVVLAPRVARLLVGEWSVPVVGTWMLLSPFLWHASVYRGQEEVEFLAFVLGTLWLAARGRSTAAGAVAGVALTLTKLSYLPYLIAVLLGASSTWRGRGATIAAAAVPAALGYGLYLLRGGTIGGLLGEATKGYMGWNPVIVLTYPFGEVGYTAAVLLYVLVSTGLTVWVLMRVRSRSSGRRVEAGLVAAQTGTVASIPKLHGPYVAQGIAVLLLVVLRRLHTRSGRWLYVLLTVTAGVLTSRQADFGVTAWVSGLLMLVLHVGVLAVVLRASSDDPS